MAKMKILVVCMCVREREKEKKCGISEEKTEIPHVKKKTTKEIE